MLTLIEMQKLTVAQLRTLATESDNRQYSITLEHMASAQSAFMLGDMETVHEYVGRAKISHKRAQEDEAGQIRRVQAVQAVVQERGAAQDATQVGGKSVFRLIQGRGVAIWDSAWARNKS